MQTGRVRVGIWMRGIKLGLSFCFLILPGGTGAVYPLFDYLFWYADQCQSRTSSYTENLYRSNLLYGKQHRGCRTKMHHEHAPLRPKPCIYPKFDQNDSIHTPNVRYILYASHPLVGFPVVVLRWPLGQIPPARWPSRNTYFANRLCCYDIFVTRERAVTRLLRTAPARIKPTIFELRTGAARRLSEHIVRATVVPQVLCASCACRGI